MVAAQISTHKETKSMRKLMLLAAVCVVVPALWAQDPVKVDPKHYKVEFENAKVRVLRIKYEAHSKSIMHSHPDSVAVFLTDGTANMATPDGKSQAMTMKAGQAQFTPAGAHLPENTGDKAFELVLVELKGGGAAKAAAKPAAKK
jgi:quercetin dioxygenase-like cupin family protein